MRTTRLLPVSSSMHCSGGVGVYLPGDVPARLGVPAWGVYLPVGVPAQGGVPARLGVPAWGVYLPVGVPAQGGVPARLGVPAWGVYLPVGVPAQGGVPAQVLPLWTEWLTDMCKNITFANFVCER